MITTSEGLRNYKPEQRKCFYQSERRLHFFKMYTQDNCEKECLANLTKTMCGCVKFSMPSKYAKYTKFNCNFISTFICVCFIGDNATKICGAAKIKCYLNIQNILLYEDQSENIDNKSFHDKCNCWPACTSIKYDADISQYKLDPDIVNVSFGSEFK